MDALTRQPPASGQPVVQQSTTADDGDLDWFSVEDVAVAVDKAVLEGMQRLWKQHAARMDKEGRDFAEGMLGTHRDAVQTVAGIRDFDLPTTLSAVNKYTCDVRDRVLAHFATLRGADDEFAAALYGAVRATFSINLRQAIEARDEWYHSKLRGLRARFEDSLAAARACIQAEVARALEVQRAELEAAARAEQEERDLAALKVERRDVVDALSKEVAELKDKFASLSTQLTDMTAQRDEWQVKWAEERARGDSIRRECLVAIQRTEEHVSKLQHQHVAELSQRDYVLRRCKDTMVNLEAQLGVIGTPIDDL